MGKNNALNDINRSGSFSLQEKRTLREITEATFANITALEGDGYRNGVWEYFDDFNQKVIDETNENWILNAGSDPQAVDPVIVVAEGGTAFLDAGDGDGSVAEDGSQIILAIPVQADTGGLEFGGRFQVEDIALCSVNFGLTDVTTLEEPFSVSGTTVTSVATNGVCFVFDDGADTKGWYVLGVDGGTDATGNGLAVGEAAIKAPVNDTYQTFKCLIDSDGEKATFYINGFLVGTLTASVVSATTNLYLTLIAVGDGANGAATGVTVDYMYVRTTRG